MASMNKRADGARAEASAMAYLRERGYRWLASNVFTKAGEIDLVVEGAGVVVFVEVKRRRSARYGLPEEAVTALKMRRLVRASMVYLAAKGLAGRQIRYDVIAIDAEGLRHHVDAFRPEPGFGW